MITEQLRQQLVEFELNSLLVHQHGEIRDMYEKFPHASRERLPINSCTKSFLSALICIAMEREQFPSPDVLLSDYFPAIHSDKNERKKRITIEHVLTMTPGFQWTEFGGANSFPKMSRSSDWIQFVLDQPVVDEPGTKWIYNSGASQLLAEILKQSIGMPVAQFAEQHLFGPLGIEYYEWKKDPSGTHTGGFGMKMAAHDLLKFGLLYLYRGVWNDKRIISQNLIERSVVPAIIADDPPERGYYGWHWWVDSVEVPRESNRVDAQTETLDYFYARGYAGQFVFVIPSCDAVVVTTRERNKKGYFPHDLFRHHIAPLLVHSDLAVVT